jgi:hypothetical protein
MTRASRTASASTPALLCACIQDAMSSHSQSGLSVVILAAGSGNPSPRWPRANCVIAARDRPVAFGDLRETDQRIRFDALDFGARLLHIPDSRRNRLFERLRFAAELQNEHAALKGDGRVIAARFEESVLEVLQPTAPRHWRQSRIRRSSSFPSRTHASLQSHRSTTRRRCLPWLPGFRGVDQTDTWQPSLV